MAIQRGTKAVYWSAVTACSTGLASGMIQSVDFAEEADEKEIKDVGGDVKSIVFSNARQTCTLEIIPSGTTLALAKAANVLPSIGDTIYVVDSDDAEVQSQTWICTGASKRKSVENESVLTVNLRKYAVDLPIISS